MAQPAPAPGGTSFAGKVFIEQHKALLGFCIANGVLLFFAITLKLELLADFFYFVVTPHCGCRCKVICLLLCLGAALIR